MEKTGFNKIRATSSSKFWKYFPINFLVILILMGIPTSVLGQSFSSPITQHLPSEFIEVIQRTIEIQEEKIAIITDTQSGKDIQELHILSQHLEDLPGYGKTLIYNCTSTDQLVIYLVLIPILEKVERVEVIIPEQEHSPYQHSRFLVD